MSCDLAATLLFTESWDNVKLFGTKQHNERTEKRTSGQTGRRTERQTDRQANRQTDLVYSDTSWSLLRRRRRSGNVDSSRMLWQIHHHHHHHQYHHHHRHHLARTHTHIENSLQYLTFFPFITACIRWRLLGLTLSIKNICRLGSSIAFLQRPGHGDLRIWTRPPSYLQGHRPPVGFAKKTMRNYCVLPSPKYTQSPANTKLLIAAVKMHLHLQIWTWYYFNKFSPQTTSLLPPPIIKPLDTTPLHDFCWQSLHGMSLNIIEYTLASDDRHYSTCSRQRANSTLQPSNV